MGRHSSNSIAPVTAASGVPAVRRAPGPVQPIAVTRQPSVRPRSRSRAALFAFAFLASSGFVLVNVVDPSAGTVASPYYRVAQRWTPEEVQALDVASSAEGITLNRDGYTVTPKPTPTPEPVPAETAGSWSAPAAGTPDPGTAMAIGYDMVMAMGWGQSEYDCLVALWNRESHWNVYAGNPSSGAYGIPQALPGEKMASAGPDWQSNPETQIRWGLGYIAGRYGSACGAWAHSEDAGWY